MAQKLGELIDEISIHALREEDDLNAVSYLQAHDHFYPRPPRGGRQGVTKVINETAIFLSTPSARRATKAALAGLSVIGDFYPRPPRGGRLFPVAGSCYNTKISIHALREEGDHPDSCTGRRHAYFYPRPPRGGRQLNNNLNPPTRKISIHALREEGDSTACSPRFANTGFLSTPSARRATCGCLASLCSSQQFLSTPSARRATGSSPGNRHLVVISIHALREEGDLTSRLSDLEQQISIHALREEGDPRASASSCRKSSNFYPRPPRGGRPHSSTVRLSGGAFLSTPSARRATNAALCHRQSHLISIPALREEGDTCSAVLVILLRLFLSPPSARRATPRCRKA